MWMDHCQYRTETRWVVHRPNYTRACVQDRSDYFPVISLEANSPIITVGAEVILGIMEASAMRRPG